MSAPMPKVLILGAHGMLGSMVARVLTADPGLDVITTARASPSAGADRGFDVRSDSLASLLDDAGPDWVINAIGVLKARIDERVPGSIEDAVAVNALFPHRLASETAARGQRVIQIATDGVFAGASGPYDEAAPHDAHDVYGKTKSLGEVPAGHVWHLRCSIVGPERGTPSSLLGWVLSSPPGAELTGFDGHRWNGITTLHFARLCAAIIAGGQTAAGLRHVVPADAVTKAELLELALNAFDRTDVSVKRVPGPGAPIDRTLSTRDPKANQKLWRAAGYEQPPTIAEMLGELAAAERAATPAGAS